MKRATRWGALSALLLCVVSVPVARADVGPPIKVQVVPPPSGVYPVQGQPFSATLMVTSAEPGDVANFELRGTRRGTAPTWSNVTFSIPPETIVPVEAFDPLTVDFTVTPQDPTDPVVFSFLWNGRMYSKTVRMLPLHAINQAKGVDQTVEEPDDFDPRPLNKTGFDTVEPRLRPEPEQIRSPQEAAEDALRSGSDKGYNIRVKGRFFAYRTPDGKAFGADGVTVRVMDEDVDWDDTLATFATDPWGYFDVTFNYNQSEDPDIYLEFEAANTRVEVEETDIWENNYTWRTGTKDDYTGSFIDYGSRRPSNDYYYPAVYILTTATRTYRWVKDVAGFTTPSVCVQWPESDSNSWYNPFWEEIHINAGKQWREDTLAHEYGHHWVENFADDDGSDYCNAGGRCDSGGDCGHCIWCEESGGDAWQEGFPNMLADFVTASLEGDYGLKSRNFRSMEDIDICPEVGMLDDPYKTEGHIGALLRDIIDSAQDDEDSYSRGADEMDLTASQIFNLVADYEPLSPLGFINRLMLQYPSLISQIWATCENNGYSVTDNGLPGLVSSLGSPSHALFDPSPDATIQYTWTAATDAISGVDGYSVSVTASSTLPNTSKDIGKVTSYTTPELSPGTYYFNIRTVDRAGNWSSSYKTYGPITIREPYPPDFRPYTTQAGWTYPMMPSATNNCGFATCGTPSALAGNSVTYLNVAYQNHGEQSSIGTNWKGLVYIDGTAVGGILSFSANVPVGGVWAATGLGPFAVKGGRHMLGTFIDYNEANPEQNEADNRYARQWVWSPYTLSTSTVLSRPAPQSSLGGFLSTPWLYSPNSDGFRFVNTGNSFYSVVAWADDDTEDFDLWMFPQSTGPTNGFDLAGGLTTGGLSVRPEGCLDMVMFRYDVAGANVFDAGVTNTTGAQSGFKVVKEWASSVTMGTPVNAQIPANRYLTMRQFEVLWAQNFTVDINVDPAAGPVQVALYDKTFATGDLLDYNAHAVTDENGVAQITHNTTTGGWMCLAIFQDPKETPAAKKGAAINVGLDVYTTPADLTSAKPFGWYAPLVPRLLPDGTWNNVPAPSWLSGNADATYLNYAWKNSGPNSSPWVNARIYVDGVSKVYSALGPVSPGATVTSNISFPVEVKGGRHTLHVRYDVNNTANESDETNNGYGLQFVWSPASLTRDTPVSRPMPEGPTEGWDDALEGGISTLHFNCDGLRMTEPVVNPLTQAGWWQAIATMPGASSDVDVRLHELSTSSVLGFDDIRAASGWIEGQSDFVMVNYRATSPVRPMDAGVVGEAGQESYTAEWVESKFLANSPSGTYGTFDIAAGSILDLHEVFLRRGAMGVVLQELLGDVDWGISLYEGGLPYHGKSSTAIHALSWMNPASGLESIYVDVPVDGYYCVAVWKKGASDLPKLGKYELSFVPGATNAPSTPVGPSVTALTSIHPNPFNPRTTVAFDLAREGRVQIGVYNLRGELVRTLLDEARPVGRHEVRWDGVDQSGHRVASGTYFARMVAGGQEERRKMILLK